MKHKSLDYDEAKDLFSDKTGKLRNMIIQDRRTNQEEIYLLKDRINSILDTSQIDIAPRMGTEDQVILRKL